MADTITIKNRIIKNTFFYVSIPIFKFLITFLTLPIMTRYLSPSDYGKIALIVMVSQSLSGFLLLGIVEASVRFFFKYSDDKDKLSVMYSTYFSFILGGLFIGIFLLMLVFPILFKTVFKEEIALVWLLLSFVQIIFLSINLMNQYYYQNNHRGFRWAVNEIIGLGVQIPITLIFVISRVFTYQAIILGTLCGELVKFFVIFFRIDVKYRLNLQISLLKESFKYSWPTVPVMLMDIGYRTFDKIMLSLKKGIGDVGILNMSNKITLILKTLMDGITGAISPVAMEFLTQNTDESRARLAKLFLKVSALWLFISLGVILFTQEIIYILTTPEYYFVIYVVPIYIYYHVFGVFGLIAYWLIRYPGKTYWNIPINATFFVLCIGLNILLIPRYGVMGAAIASALAAVVKQIIQFMIGIRLTPIPFKLSKLFSLFLFLISFTGFLYFLYHLDLNIFFNIGIKLCIILLYIVFVIFIRIVTLDELRFYLMALIRKINLYINQMRGKNEKA